MTHSQTNTHTYDTHIHTIRRAHTNTTHDTHKHTHSRHAHTLTNNISKDTVS